MKLFSIKAKTITIFTLVNFVLYLQMPVIAQEKKSYLHATQDPVDSLLPMLGGLLVILVFIFFLAFLFKRFGHLNSGTRLINIVESYAVGSKEKIAIVRVENECFLIGITANSINPIGKLESLNIDEINKNTENKENSATGFAPLMAKFMSGQMTTEIMNKKNNSEGVK